MQLQRISGRTTQHASTKLDLSEFDLPARQSQLLMLINRVSDIRSGMERLSSEDLCNSLDQEAPLRELLDWAFQTEREFSTWLSSVPHEQLPTVIETSPDLKERPSYGPAMKLYIFSGIQDGCRWLTCWTSRIYLLRAILDGLAKLSTSNSTYTSPLSHGKIQSTILKMADCICSSVPSMIGEVDDEGRPSANKGIALGAYFMTRFLDIINEIPWLPLKQRLWSWDVLDRLGREWGIGGALRARTRWMGVYALDTQAVRPDIAEVGSML